MNYKKTLSVLFILLLILVPGTFFFFLYRMGAGDAKALSEFPVAYNNFDQAMADYTKAIFMPDKESKPNTSDLELIAEQAQLILNKKAAVRISSLTRNDGELMQIATQIATLAGREVEVLKAYQATPADQRIDTEQFKVQIRDFENQRQADFIRYIELAGIR